MNIETLLPIGTIISLKNAEKRLMIFGIKQSDAVNEDKEYDYCGVIYPEGNIGQKGHFLFNHTDIDKIYFKGYEDIERQIFIKKIKQLIDKENNE